MLPLTSAFGMPAQPAKPDPIDPPHTGPWTVWVIPPATLNRSGYGGWVARKLGTFGGLAAAIEYARSCKEPGAIEVHAGGWNGEVVMKIG